jgi:hypothetical protein
LSKYVDQFTQGEGTHYFAFSACDAAGHCSAYSAPFVVTYDHTTPAVPANLSWTDSDGHTVANSGATNLYAGTASWQDGSSDVNHYIYKYWNDISGNPYKVGSEYTTSVSGTSLPGVFNQGEGVHHFCIEAVDAAGNTSACSASFTITYDATAPTTPVPTPSAGTYTTTQLVTLHSTDTSGDTPRMYYTTDGSTPNNTGNGTLYIGAFNVSTSETIKAVAYDTASNVSNDLTAAYTITPVITTNFTITNFSRQLATIGNSSNTGNGTAGNTTTSNGTPAVLGTTTGNTGKVKGDNTVNLKNAGSKKSGNFLLFGWWWLAIIAVLGAFWLILAKRRSSDEG